MSAVTVKALDGLRARAVAPGVAEHPATRWRVVAYLQARSVAPPLVLLGHEITGWWQMSRLERRVLRSATERAVRS